MEKEFIKKVKMGEKVKKFKSKNGIESKENRYSEKQQEINKRKVVDILVESRDPEFGAKLFSEDEKERAKAILKQLDGLSITRAQCLLAECQSSLMNIRIDMGQVMI